MQVEVTVSQFDPFPRELTDEQREVLGLAEDKSESILRSLIALAAIVNGNLGIGYPAGDDLSTTSTPALVDNLRLAWATVKFTSLSQLGANATVTINHNLDIPVYTFTTGGGSTTMNLLNVRWIEAGWQLGDKTETSAGSGAVTNSVPTSVSSGAQHFGILRYTQDAITRNSVDLRFYSSIDPSSSLPIYVDFLVIPAVR